MKNFNLFLFKSLIFDILDKPSIKNINVKFIQLGFGKLNKCQKSLSFIIANMRTLSNYYIEKGISINRKFIKLAFDRLDKF